MSTHNLCFEQKYEKYQRFLSENCRFLEVKFSIHCNRLVFVIWDTSREKGNSDFPSNKSFSANARPLRERIWLVLWLKFPLGPPLT